MKREKNVQGCKFPMGTKKDKTVEKKKLKIQEDKPKKNKQTKQSVTRSIIRKNGFHSS